jgi:hypothetical protein
MKVNMKPLVLAYMAFMLTTLPTVAAPKELPRAKIEKVLGAYANTVGCDFEMDRKNIVEMDIEGYGEKEFIALFINDDGCSGGSGSWSSKLAVLDRHTENPNKGGIYVLPEMTMPVAPGVGFPRFIDRIFVKNGQLWFAGRVHAEKDGNNFPTIPVQAQIQLLTSEVQVDGDKGAIYYWKSTKDFQGK